MPFGGLLLVRHVPRVRLSGEGEEQIVAIVVVVLISADLHLLRQLGPRKREDVHPSRVFKCRSWREGKAHATHALGSLRVPQILRRIPALASYDQLANQCFGHDNEQLVDALNNVAIHEHGAGLPSDPQSELRRAANSNNLLRARGGEALGIRDLNLLLLPCFTVPAVVGCWSTYSKCSVDTRTAVALLARIKDDEIHDALHGEDQLVFQPIVDRVDDILVGEAQTDWGLSDLIHAREAHLGKKLTPVLEHTASYASSAFRFSR